MLVACSTPMLTEIAGQLGIDHTFYFQFGLIIALYFILSAFYFKPFQKLFAEREAKTIGAQKETQALNIKAESKLEQYKEKLKYINDQARKVMQHAEEQGKKDASNILSEASNKARSHIQQLQKDLETQRINLQDALNRDSTSIASEVVTKILGRSVQMR